MILLKEGSLAEAQTAAQDLSHLIETSMKKTSVRYLYHIQGLISEAQGQSVAAIDNFQKAISLLPAVFDAENWHSLFHYALASAFLRAGETEKARQQYETIISFTVGRMHCGDLYVRALYELGNLYRAMGETEKAKQNYEHFMRILGDSGHMSSEISDVKKWLTSLRGP